MVNSVSSVTMTFDLSFRAKGNEGRLAQTAVDCLSVDVRFSTSSAEYSSNLVVERRRQNEWSLDSTTLESGEICEHFFTWAHQF